VTCTYLILLRVFTGSAEIPNRLVLKARRVHLRQKAAFEQLRQRAHPADPS
jgi:hypothetical protein